MNKWIDDNMIWIVLITFAAIIIVVSYLVFTGIMPLETTNITSKDLIV